MDLDNITLEDVKVPGREPAPSPLKEAAQEGKANTEEKVNATPEVEQAKTDVKVESSEEPTANVAASFDFKDKTNGKYSSFEELWNDFTELQGKDTTPKFKDDYIEKVVSFYDEHGDLTPFLEETRFNYDDMSDEDVLRKKMRDEYKGLGKDAFERKFQRYLDKNFDPDEDDDVREELIRYEANKVRKELKEKQSAFLNSKSSKNSEPEVNLEEEFKKWKGVVESNDSIKSLKEQKGLKIKYGDEEFTYEIDPDSVIEQAIDNRKFWSNFATEVNGEPSVDFSKFNKVAAYATDPESFERRLIEYGKSLGKENLIDELENPTEIKTPRRESSDRNSSSGDWRDDFFEALKKQK